MSPLLLVSVTCLSITRQSLAAEVARRWADGAVAPQTTTDLSSSGTQSLIVRFNPVARGAVLEV